MEAPLRGWTAVAQRAKAGRAPFGLIAVARTRRWCDRWHLGTSWCRWSRSRGRACGPSRSVAERLRAIAVGGDRAGDAAHAVAVRHRAVGVPAGCSGDAAHAAPERLRLRPGWRRQQQRDEQSEKDDAIFLGICTDGGHLPQRARRLTHRCACLSETSVAAG